jgi:hypothetical protein
MSTIEERYGRAVNSSYMKMRETTTGDVDTLAAAGMAAAGRPVETGVAGEVRKESPGRLGVLLMRLRSEYDTTRRAQLLGDTNYSTLVKAAHEARRPIVPLKLDDNGVPLRDAAGQLVKPTPAEIESARQIAADLSDRLRAEANNQALTAHLFILIELKTLSSVSNALRTHAYRLAERRGVRIGMDPIPNEDPTKPAKRSELDQLVSDVVDAWLDRRCHRCDGRGFTGGYEGPVMRCRACNQSGNRRLGIFSDRLAIQDIAEKLLCAMDAKNEAAARATSAKSG